MTAHAFPSFCGILLLFFLLPPLSPAAGDDYDAELARLKKLSISKLGRESIIREFENLIARFPNDPRNPLTMIHVSRLYSSYRTPETNVRQDKIDANRWAERAAQSSKRGSKEWIEARFIMFGYLSNIECDYEKARRLLSDIESGAQNRVALAKVAERKIWLAEKTGDYKTALKEYKQLVNDNLELGRQVAMRKIAPESSGINELLEVERGATHFILGRLSLGFGSISDAQREFLVNDLLTSLPHNPKLQHDGMLTLQKIQDRLQGRRCEGAPDHSYAIRQ